MTWWHKALTHDDIIKWEHFPSFWQGIHLSPPCSLWSHCNELWLWNILISAPERFTHKQLERHGCILSNVATDAQALKHQAISIHRINQMSIAMEQFQTKVLHSLWKTLENRNRLKRIWLRCLRVNINFLSLYPVFIMQHGFYFLSPYPSNGYPLQDKLV